MLGACKESRDVYLAQNTHCLPINANQDFRVKPVVYPMGRLYFRPEDAVVFIQKCITLRRDREFATFVKERGKGRVISEWMSGIRYLATKPESLYLTVEREAWSGRGGGPSVSKQTHALLVFVSVYSL